MFRYVLFVALLLQLLGFQAYAQDGGTETNETTAPPASIEGLAPAAGEMGKIQLGVSYIAFHYLGDLTNKRELFHRFYSGAGVSLQIRSRKWYYPQFNAGIGRIVAQDREIPQTGGLFSNRFVETQFYYFNFMFHVRFLRRLPVKPHAGLGVGILNFSPRDRDNNLLPDLTDTRKPGEEYASVTPMIPFALGVTYDINRFFSFNLDFSYIFLGTDYFDNVGQLGNRKGPDSMQSIQFTVFYTFNKRERKGKSSFFR